MTGWALDPGIGLGTQQLELEHWVPVRACSRLWPPWDRQVPFMVPCSCKGSVKAAFKGSPLIKPYSTLKGLIMNDRTYPARAAISLSRAPKCLRSEEVQRRVPQSRSFRRETHVQPMFGTCLLPSGLACQSCFHSASRFLRGKEGLGLYRSV